MENLPFPDEIVLKILGYLNIFDLAKCAQVSKQLMNLCEDKEFQYCELKKIFKNSNLKLASNDFIMVGVSYQDAVKAIKEALKQNGRRLELIMERKGQFDNGSCVFTVELYGVNSLFLNRKFENQADDTVSYIVSFRLVSMSQRAEAVESCLLSTIFLGQSH